MRRGETPGLSLLMTYELGQEILQGSGAALDTVFEGDENFGDCLVLPKLVEL